ncbi:MAG: hypothetical protein H6673_15570 [Anaerolineales bacterium]|nr:hypothetical protein [Anaerolineales bacterium]
MTEPSLSQPLIDLHYRTVILEAWQALSPQQQASLALILVERALATTERVWLVETLWLRLTMLFEAETKD